MGAKALAVCPYQTVSYKVGTPCCTGYVRFWLSAGRGGFGLSSAECESPAFYCMAYSHDGTRPDIMKGWKVLPFDPWAIAQDRPGSAACCAKLPVAASEAPMPSQMTMHRKQPFSS